MHTHNWINRFIENDQSVDMYKHTIETHTTNQNAPIRTKFCYFFFQSESLIHSLVDCAKERTITKNRPTDNICRYLSIYIQFFFCFNKDGTIVLLCRRLETERIVKNYKSYCVPLFQLYWKLSEATNTFFSSNPRKRYI